jgi:DNA-binding winged helix-turn-helix (wHTH) protein
MDEETFAFGSFRLIPAQRMLLDGERSLRLGSRALDILIALVESAGETIHKDRLIARIWPDTVVDEGALRVHVAALRKALGDGRAGKRYIANNPGRGYSFVAPVAREQRQPATAQPDAAATGGNLPAPLTRIVGRDDIIAALAAQLVRRRFLTIVGPCGIGKTTVALGVAETLSASYRDGVWFVALASLPEPDLVPSALGAALGISLSGVDPVLGLTAWLRDKRGVIVLDSCEHVVGAAAAIAEAILKAAPRVNILATSREQLRAEGRVAAPPGLAGTSAANGLANRRRGNAVFGRRAIQRARYRNRGRVRLRRRRCLGGSGDLSPARWRAAGARTSRCARRCIWHEPRDSTIDSRC